MLFHFNKLVGYSQKRSGNFRSFFIKNQLFLFFSIDQAIFAIISAIYHSHSFRIRIEKHEEAVSQKIHLQNSFFRRHRADIEMFRLHDLKISICLCCVEKTVKGNQCVCKDGPVINVKNLLWD